MIWDRERYLAHCNFEFTGREMFCELFGPLNVLEKEWLKQGATPEEINMTAFDWDYVLKTNLGVNCGCLSNIQPYVIEENDEFILSKDNMGRTVKLCKNTASIPLPLEYPIKDFDEWLKIKHWYEFDEKRIDIEKLREQKKLRDKGYLTVLNVPGGFDEPRQLLGEEELCIACYEEPELIEDILKTIGDTTTKVIERIADIVPIDCVSIHEDMAGKSGPLFGPVQVTEFMQPYYKKIWHAAKQAGCMQFSQDSDGNMNPVLDDIAKCEVNCVYPCEPAAGMDIVKLREKYGKTFMLKGGIDKHVLREDRNAIIKELEYKFDKSMLGGGTVFALDHRIPNGVALDDYKFYVNSAREMLKLEPISALGWDRMAF